MRRSRLLVAASLGLCLSLPGEPCTGKSADLVPAQCSAWIDMFDGTAGNDWLNCERTRTDPCNCDMGTASGTVCNEDFTVIENLVIPFNNMVGTLPASMSALVNVTFVDFEDNTLSGPLPALPWDRMGPEDETHNCHLYGFSDRTGERENAFDCPLPDGVLALPCRKATKQSSRVPINATDCGPPPAPTPGPPKYRCENNKCTEAATGESLKRCQNTCGPSSTHAFDFSP